MGQPWHLPETEWAAVWEAVALLPTHGSPWDGPPMAGRALAQARVPPATGRSEASGTESRPPATQSVAWGPEPQCYLGAGQGTDTGLRPDYGLRVPLQQARRGFHCSQV